MGYFGEKLKTIRTNKGLRQEDISRNMGVSRQAYARFESLTFPPKYETIEKIAAALGCAPEDLTGKSPYEQLQIETAQESFIMADLEEAMDTLNNTGKQKVVEYAQDMSKIPEYKK